MNIKKTTLLTQLTLLFLGIAVTSCQLMDMEEMAVEEDTDIAKLTGIPSSSNIIYEETFEGLEPFYAYVDKQFGADHAFSVSSTESLRGKNSGRFELKRNDPRATDNGKRAEVFLPEIAHEERWYSFGVYLPAKGYAKDRNNDILCQWHQLGVNTAPMSLRVQNDRFLIRMKINSVTATEEIDLGPSTKDKWHEFTFHIIHSGGKDGLLEIWHNDKKVETRNGATISKGPLPRWKMGIYKPTWAGNGHTDSDHRVAYFDNIRMGSENATYDDMKPSERNLEGWGPDVDEIENLTTINAFSNMAVGKIDDGGTINRRLLQTERVSIKAEINKGFKGSIQFDLEGPVNNSYIDNKAPFALFGDDSNGKYYHSGGLPKGDYTLTVTPYAHKKAKGKASKSKTIRFTVIDEKVVDNSLPTVESLTLIQANTNTEWGEIEDGAKIYAKDLGTHKLTIRANLSSSFKGRVLFELSGAGSRTSYSDSAPFVLNNYRNGNYTFGSGLRPGSYTIKVTPFLKDGGKDLQGAVSTVRFKII